MSREPEKERCAVCRFWRCEFVTQQIVDGVAFTSGICRHNPPERLAEGISGTSWPQTSGTDWCGKFQHVNPARVEIPAIEKALGEAIARGPAKGNPGTRGAGKPERTQGRMPPGATGPTGPTGTPFLRPGGSPPGITGSERPPRDVLHGGADRFGTWAIIAFALALAAVFARLLILSLDH